MLIAMLVCVALVLSTILIHYEVLRLASGMCTTCRSRHACASSGRHRRLHRPHLEVWLYGIAYWAMTAHSPLGAVVGAGPLGTEDYIYFSAVTYTSLGFGDLVPRGHLRLVAGVEGLNGLILIGWSASFTYLAMERYWPLHRDSTRNRQARTRTRSPRELH